MTVDRVATARSVTGSVSTDAGDACRMRALSPASSPEEVLHA